MAAMSVYKLRHFATILFQLMNENDSHAKEAIMRSSDPSNGATVFIPLDQRLRHFEGLKLIIQCADRFYYIAKNEFSVGMYINLKNEED
jgi:hypothetical protein